MSCVEDLLKRRSIRHYKDEPVPQSVLDKILEAGRQAPSAVNRQPWHFILIQDQIVKEKIIHPRYSGFLKDAVFAIVGVCFLDDPVTQRWAFVDTTIALQNMVNAAWLMGVGSCWIGGFREEKIKQILNIPEEARVVAIISFGIPDEKPTRTKKPLKDIIHHNKW
jgi:nitroreductase